MHDRTLLGPADVDDATLTAMVADLLSHDEVGGVELVSSSATPVPYDVPSITTVGRYWVSGLARTSDGEERWRVFVKHVQSWRHSPFFAFVPEEAREMAAATMPWRIEALVYRSDLADRLPDGLSMPRALGVVDLEPEAAVMWLPEVAHSARTWAPDDYESVAFSLGRLAGSPRVAERADVGCFPWTIHDYVHGRLAHDVLPTVMSTEAWQAPGVMEAFGPDLRERLRTAASRTVELGTELHGLPRANAHGDASPNNLLPGKGPDDIVLIDFAFFMAQPVGFDLGQLIAGETQLGRGPVDLAAVDAACVAAYARGMAAEGQTVDDAVLRRAHALQLFLMAGVSSLPDREVMPVEQLRQRAALARLSLDLLDATG